MSEHRDDGNYSAEEQAAFYEGRPLREVWLGEFCATHLHKASRNFYQVIGRGHDCTNGTPPRPVVIYRDSAGSIWTRYAPEFDDGRFEKL